MCLLKTWCSYWCCCLMTFIWWCEGILAFIFWREEMIPYLVVCSVEMLHLLFYLWRDSNLEVITAVYCCWCCEHTLYHSVIEEAEHGEIIILKSVFDMVAIYTSYFQSYIVSVHITYTCLYLPPDIVTATDDPVWKKLKNLCPSL